jgi:hypothetical protein
MISSRACEVVAKDASIVLWAREYNGKAPIGFVRSQMRLVECFDRYIPSGVGKWSGQCTSVEATADVTTDGWLVVGYRRE